MRALGARLRAAWMTLTGTGAAASVAFGLLVFVSVLASVAIPRESAELRSGALHRVIAASQPSDRTVVATVNELALTGGSGQLQAADIAAASARLRARLAAGGLPVASDPPAWASLTTGSVPVTGAAPAAGYGPPQVKMIYRSALARYSRVVAGRLPAGASAAGATTPGIQAVVQVAVTAATAARFGLRPGSRLRAGPLLLTVTGIIRPADAASGFWSQDRLAARPAPTAGSSDQPPYWLGAVFIGPGALPPAESALDIAQMELTFAYPAALGRLTAGQASGVEAGVSSLLSSGVTVAGPGEPPVAVAVTSQIPGILNPFIAAESAVDPVLELLYVSLTAMGAVVVLLGARLVAQRRTAEFTLMRARGAALYQLAWVALRASLLIGAAAGAAAVALAVALTPQAPGEGGTVSWWLAGFTLAVTIAGPVLISVIPQRVAAPVTGRPRRPAGRKPGARRIVAEAALVAAAIGGLVVLRNQGPSPGSSGLYTSAAPVLVAIPVAVVVLRCYPPLARELARIAGLSRGVVAFVGLTRATRTPPGTVLPSFALVLVLAMVAFPGMVSTAVARGQAAASWRQVGADAVVQAPPGQVITPALERQISAVPGVVSTATAAVETGELTAGTVLSVVFTDPARYAAVVGQAPGPRFPAAALSKKALSKKALSKKALAGTAQPGNATAVPAVATAAAARLVGRAPASLMVGTSTVTIRLAGQVGSVPGAFDPTGNGVVILPWRALGPQPPAPGFVLVAGSGLDAARLSAAVRRALPGGSVTLRATALAALATAPVPQAAQTALTEGTVAAAGFGALVLLLSLLLTARTREMTLARLATMGLRRWQAQLMLATEALPPVLAAAVGGVACAWLLAPLVGPALNLGVFDGTGPPIVVAPAVYPLAASATGLLLAALLVLALQAAITYQRGSARALRLDD
ncbi:MAG TPA: FtsX-like permease family protein [Streptosporangiaceae bacterium]|nr:FtsX-like permease family protein [Streptosporangiaceae bacterium]HEX5290253.1 FtsX-like permease family protein [Streptosporangiaceae bacterium]